MDPRPPAPRRPPLLSTGLFLLAVSFLIALLDGGAEGGPAPGAVVWIQSAAFWAGMVCVAGHVLRLALAPAAVASPPSSASWGETEGREPRPGGDRAGRAGQQS